MIGNVHDARLFSVVVAAEKVVFRFRAEIRGRGAGVLMAGNIRIAVEEKSVVRAELFVVCNRVGRNRALVVEPNVVYVLGKENVVIFVDGDGGVLPPEEGTAQGGKIVDLRFRFKDTLPLSEAHPHHALHPIHGVVLGEPYRDRVFVPFHAVIHGHEGGRAVMEGPVEFQPARSPGAEHADERGFDDVVFIEKFVTVFQIFRIPDLAAEFGQNPDFQKLVLESEEGILPLFAHRSLRFEHDFVGIGIARRALVHPVFREHGEFFPLRLGISIDEDFFLAEGNFHFRIFSVMTGSTFL